MLYQLGKFVNMWDEASLEALGSEFYMMDLLHAQKITNEDGSSICDDLSFEGGRVVNVPESLVYESSFFRAAWEKEDG